jgi:hypothetical protein
MLQLLDEHCLLVRNLRGRRQMLKTAAAADAEMRTAGLDAVR